MGNKFSNNFLYIDMEFRNVTEEFVTLVCCTTMLDNEIKEWWLYQDKSKQRELKSYLLENKNQKLVSYAAQAEARSFLSLDLDPLEFNWIDLYLEWRCLTNHNDKLNWGNQLVDGKVKFTRKPPPKWERTEEDSITSFKHTHSLAEATYKLTGKIRDTEHKNLMRDLIISGESFSRYDEVAIQKYCTEDVKFLPELLKAMVKEYHRLEIRNKNELLTEMELRGRYAAITAKMESWGYPIDYQKTKNFSKQVGCILEECQREINKLFPDIRPFKFHKKDSKFTWDQKKTREWISNNCDVKRWMRTETGNLSLSLEAFTRMFDFKHSYPKDNFGAQMIRYLKLKQNLNGFSPNTKTKSFWDFVGRDKRVRPYFGIYGSQSSRSQPSSSGFLFLKPAWMRSLCSPPKGKAIASFDYSSEEFLVSALWANDKNMIEAYRSGDVYLAYGKLIGAIPKDGTKADYKKERDLAKACLAKGTLVLVKNKGYIEIQEVKKGDFVWGGSDWKKVIQESRSMGFYTLRDLVKTNNIYSTQDHKFLASNGVFYEINEETQFRRGTNWKICKENSRGLHRPSSSWTDVWRLVCQIGYTYINRIRAIFFS